MHIIIILKQYFNKIYRDALITYTGQVNKLVSTLKKN